ncbi:MAG TPA: thioredoxin domain-containing protein [Sphingomonadaceae bacterium]|nr:thioredoxin domain-containing protein [Sphingomonadaceae bacterium]
MRGFGLIAALAAAVTALLPLPHAALSAAPAAKDWSHTVTTTADGAYILGNPAAKVRIVEYLSFTCPHCAHFAAEAMPPLTADYIRPGLVSIEARHALRDPADFAAALLTRCAGPSTYFAAAGRVFAGQETWFPKLAAYEQANQDKLKAMSHDEALSAIAGAAGLASIAGVPADRAKACLADKAEQDRLGKMATEAWTGRKIEGTPSFLLNGTLLAGTATWEALKPKIDAALRK